MDMRTFQPTTPVRRGDRVSVVSPSDGLPGLFPWVQDLGLERLRTRFGLEPVEYPTTRTMGASVADRARDVMAAFADPTTSAVFTSVGGDDQVHVVQQLDPQVFLDHPKPFFGYSDNTHLHSFLWNLGIASYYAIAVMAQLTRAETFDATASSLERALFTSGEVEMDASAVFTDAPTDPSGEVLDWADRSSLDRPRLVEPAEPVVWDGDGDAAGVLWGGCMESLVVQAATGIGLPDGDALDRSVLMVESAESLPQPWLVDTLFTAYGERGWFDRFQAVLVGRPTAWSFDRRNDAPTRAGYRQTQRETVLAAVRRYHPTIPVVQGLDFGHTDPQVVMPLGRQVRLDSGRIWLTY